MRVEEVIGHHIRESREAHGLSQEELGAAVTALLDRTWTRQAVSDAEKGKRLFAARELVAFSVVMNCRVADLFLLPADADSLELPGEVLTRSRLEPKLSDTADLAELRRTLIDLGRAADELTGVGSGIRRTVQHAQDELNRVLIGATES